MTRDGQRAGKAAVLSALVPGAGQWFAGHRRRGLLFAVPFVLGGIALIVLASRGVVGIAELLVQPRWLWVLVAGNLLLALTKVAAVADIWRSEGMPSPWWLAGAGVLVVVLSLPHVLVHDRATEAIALLEDVFTPEPLAPLEEREAELLAEGATDLGPTTVPPSEPMPSTTTTIPEGPPPALPIITTTTEPFLPLAPDDLAAALYARLAAQLEAAAIAAEPDPVPEYAADERITILLAGGDFGPGRRDLRTDVMIVATFNLHTNTAALISVSRELGHVPLPSAWARSGTMISVQAWHEDRAYQEVVEAAEEAGEEPPPQPPLEPCDCFADRINYLHVVTADWIHTYPDAPDPGMEALRETLEILLGIPIDHYVLVDFAGFVELVDALGGVDVNVTETMDVAFSPAFEGEDPVSVTVEPGLHHFDGRTALAYVRNRTGSSDNVRMQRQRCMLHDLAAAADPVTLLRDFPEIARAVRAATVTTVPLERLPDLIRATASLEEGSIATLAIDGRYSSDRNYMDLPIVETAWVRAAVTDLLSSLAEGDIGEHAPTECG
jgi:LCP family protein required for cell wall assembly